MDIALPQIAGSPGGFGGAAIGLEGRIEFDVRRVVQKQIELDVGVAEPLHRARTSEK